MSDNSVETSGTVPSDISSVPSSPVVLSVRDLAKSFGAAQALRGVSLDIRRGEFVGLMGPNGAGKSTLIKILDGIYAPDAGEIAFEGQPVLSLRGSKDAGFVHQDLALVEALSISENLRLGQEPVTRLGMLLDHGAEHELARRALTRVGLERPVDTLVADLSPGEKALVAVARALDRGAKFLIIDEATSTLTAEDSMRLVESLRQVTANGATVVMVSHKLNEILTAVDRIVVLIDGEVSVDRSRSDLDRDGLLRLLYGAEIASPPESTGTVGDPLLVAEGACSNTCGPVDLALRAGEVVGVTGRPGSGLHDVAMLVAGMARLVSGKVSMPQGGRRALVPPNRETQGGFGDLDVRRNLTISALRMWRGALGLLGGRAEQRDAKSMLARLDVRPGDPDVNYSVLSGGNKQKTIFGRAILSHAKVYVLCEPTRGVDVQTRAAIYQLIRQLACEGAAILVASSDAEDLFAVCDLVGAVEAGRIGMLHPRSGLAAESIEKMV